jgi:hypothetical protein
MSIMALQSLKDTYGKLVLARFTELGCQYYVPSSYVPFDCMGAVVHFPSSYVPFGCIHLIQQFSVLPVVLGGNAKYLPVRS